MYRREKARAHQLRMWRRFVYLRTNDFWDSGPGPWGKQLGRFRKGTGLGCPNGRKCGVCRGTREPTRQEHRSDIDFEEYLHGKEVT